MAYIGPAQLNFCNEKVKPVIIAGQHFVLNVNVTTFVTGNVKRQVEIIHFKAVKILPFQNQNLFLMRSEVIGDD